MAFDLSKPEQTTLTPEEKTWFDAQVKTASDLAVTKFKTDDEAARKAKIPEKYTFKFTDNSPLDPKADAETIAAFARKHGFSTEQATELLTHQEELAGGVLERQKQNLATTTAKWLDETKADKDLGGDNYNTTLTHVKRAMDKFAPEGSKLRTLLNESGYGNHPEWVRFVSAIGKAMAEDRAGGLGTGGGNKQLTEEERALRLYPSMKK